MEIFRRVFEPLGTVEPLDFSCRLRDLLSQIPIRPRRCARARPRPALINGGRPKLFLEAVTAVKGTGVESRRGAVAWGHAAIAPFPLPAHRTGRADFPHTALRLASSQGTRRVSLGVGVCVAE